MPRKTKPEQPTEFESAVGHLTSLLNTLDLCLSVLDDVAWAAAILGRGDGTADSLREYAERLREKRREAVPDALRRVDESLQEGSRVVRKLMADLGEAPPEAEEESEVTRDEKTGLLYRTNTVDLTMIRGDARGYVRRLPVESGDRVLDVGAHIGGATASFVEAGAALVVAVEADPGNCDLLLRNTEAFGNVVVVSRAAVPDDMESVEFFRGSDNGTSMGSLTGIRGREKVVVPAVNFRHLIEDHLTNYVKLDCEGAEHDLLAEPLPDFVDKLVVEFHANHKEWRDRWPTTVQGLLDQGFVPDRDPGRPTEKSWVWTVAWKREAK